MAPITTDQKAHCAIADCQLKRLSLMRSLLKRCGLCDTRRPFRKVLKCLVCKKTFHRLCATKEVMGNREPADASHAPAGVYVDCVREHFPANPNTIATVAVYVNIREHVAMNAIDVQTEDATGKQAKNATEAQATNDTGSPDKILSIESAPVTECSRVEKITCSLSKIESHLLCTTKALMCNRELADESHASAGVCVDGVREQIPANPDTTTTAAADVNSRKHVTENTTEAQVENATKTQAEDAMNTQVEHATEVQTEIATEAHSKDAAKPQVEEVTEARAENATEGQVTNNTGSPEQILSIESAPVVECSRDEKVTWFEYFEYLVNNTSEDEKTRLKETIARDSRPSPMLNARSSLTQTDYLELSSAWNVVSLGKSSRCKKPYKIVVHSMTLRNTAHHGLKRVRFGRDPSLMSDR